MTADTCNIVISGLTAAGKTTHSLLLAEDLDFSYVSASQIMADLAGHTVDSSTESWWDDLGDTLAAERESGALDQALDTEMCRRASETRAQVFDAWALPWTSTEPMLRIWLESTQESRMLKCRVSHLPLDYTPDECHRMVAEKDDYSRRMFQRLYHFDLFTDHQVFDFIVDSSELITEPTQASASAGIALLAPVLCDLSKWWLASRANVAVADEHKEAFWRAVDGLPAGAIEKLPSALDAGL